jgi:hypothetical protein
MPRCSSSLEKCDVVLALDVEVVLSFPPSGEVVSQAMPAAYRGIGEPLDADGVRGERSR